LKILGELVHGRVVHISAYYRRTLFEAVPTEDEFPSLRRQNFKVLCKCETRLKRYKVLAILIGEVVRESS
jgi:hypothetical protein